MASFRKTGDIAPAVFTTQILVLGSALFPEEVVNDGLLTPEDYGALAMDHIERTSPVVFQLRLVKTA